VRCDAMTTKPATMANEEGQSCLRGMIEKPPIQRDMDMAEAEEAGGVVEAMTRKTTRVSFMDASEQ